MFIVFIIVVCIAAWLMFADNSKPEKILRTLFCKNNEFEEMFFSEPPIKMLTIFIIEQCLRLEEKQHNFLNITAI